jgi:hypothetical protein
MPYAATGDELGHQLVVWLPSRYGGGLRIIYMNAYSE